MLIDYDRHIFLFKKQNNTKRNRFVGRKEKRLGYISNTPTYVGDLVEQSLEVDLRVPRLHLEDNLRSKQIADRSTSNNSTVV